ncbi:MAG: sigma-70 family RNA polymerase sigma factor [Deltaproteobacteria bacterium]|nr:sigma-70 family RNA polymerase sigma factor [Deltaproteobacteria bacterium]
MTSDAELLARWQLGDEKAASVLFDRHFVGLYRYFASKVSPADAKDLTQETFERVIRARERLSPDVGVRGYLYCVATRLLVDHLRRRDAWNRIGAGVPSVLETAGPLTPEDAVARAAQLHLLGRAVRHLPLDYQSALELHYWNGMSVREISAATGVADGTVKARLSRGRQMLYDRLRVMNVAAELSAPTTCDVAE